MFLVVPQRLYKADLDGTQERKMLNSFFILGLFFPPHSNYLQESENVYRKTSREGHSPQNFTQIP